MRYLHAGSIKTSPWKNADAYTWSVILGWLFTQPLGKTISRSWIDEWMLNKIFVSALNDLGLDERSNWRAVTLVKLLTSHHGWWQITLTRRPDQSMNDAYQTLSSLLSDMY